MLWNSIGSLTYLGCQWLITIVVVRLSAGYDAAGVLALAMTVVGIFTTFANYKMGTFQVSDIDHEHTLGEYLTFRSITLALAFVACVIYALVTCPLHTLVTVVLYYAFCAVGLLIDILHGTDQLARRMDYIGKSFLLRGPATLALFSLVFWLTGNLNLSVIGMFVASLAVLVIYDVPRAEQFEKIKMGISKEKVLYFLKTSLPAVVASLAASALFTIPKQMLSADFGDAYLGIYASVAAPALVIQMGASYLYVPLLDIFPKLFFHGKPGEFRALLIKTALGIAGVAVACAILLQLIGGWALALLFGESITPYVYLLQPILLSTATTAYLWFFGDLLITLRDFRANFCGNIAAFLSVIPLSVFCVSNWDMNGVSFAITGACLIGVIVLFCFMLVNVKKQQAAPSVDAEEA